MGISVPWLIWRFSSVFTTTLSPCFADLESRLLTSSPVTGLSWAAAGLRAVPEFMELSEFIEVPEVEVVPEFDVVPEFVWGDVCGVEVGGTCCVVGCCCCGELESCWAVPGKLEKLETA